MKKTRLALCLVLVVVCLAGCAQEQTVYQEVGTRPQPTAVRQQDIMDTAPATDPPQITISLPDTGNSQDAGAADQQEAAQTVFTVSQSKYAGATPIPLDPVDMPTPTPRPDILFEYQTYDTAMGYSFEAPIGWTMTQNESTVFVLTDPEERDGVNAQFTLSYTRVDSSYKSSQVKTELTNQLNELKRNYVEWQIWSPDSRKLLNGDGYYNIYRGVTYDGTIVRGLVHIALVDRRLVTLQYKASGYYNTSYNRVYNRIRNSIK